MSGKLTKLNMAYKEKAFSQRVEDVLYEAAKLEYIYSLIEFDDPRFWDYQERFVDPLRLQVSEKGQDMLEAWKDWKGEPEGFQQFIDADQDTKAAKAFLHGSTPRTPRTPRSPTRSPPRSPTPKRRTRKARKTHRA